MLNKNYSARKRSLIKWGVFLGLIFGVSYIETVFGATTVGSEDLGTVAQNIHSTLGNVVQLIKAVSYVAGVGFAVGAILKFKAHKDNPTQIPVGTPVALLFVAAALIFLPSLINVAGKTIFGSEATTGGDSNLTPTGGGGS